MTDRDLLERLRAEIPPPDEATRSQARRRVMAAISDAPAQTATAETGRSDGPAASTPASVDRRRRVPAWAVAAAALVVAIAAIGAWALGRVAQPPPLIDEGQPAPVPDAPLPVEVSDAVDFAGSGLAREGVVLEVHAPTRPGPWPVIVLLRGLPESGYGPFATEIAQNGAVVYNVAWWPQRTLPSPQTVAQASRTAACAVRYARTTAEQHHGDSNRVVLVGHDEGGAVGALVALAGQDFEPDVCDAAAGVVVPDGFVGLAGGYDHARAGFATNMERRPPEGFPAELDPYQRTGGNPDVPMHLIHAGNDPIMTADAVNEFADLLQAGGHEVELTTIDGTAPGDLRWTDTRAAATVIEILLQLARR